MSNRTCKTCVNNTGHIKSCAVLNKKMPENCFAWASEGIAKKQFSDMKRFAPTESQRLKVKQEKEQMRLRLARREAI